MMHISDTEATLERKEYAVILIQWLFIADSMSFRMI